MSEGIISSNGRARMRATSIIASALVLAALGAVMIIASRVTALLDQQPIEGVNVWVEERPAPPAHHLRSSPRPGVRTPDPSAAPTPTPLPVGRDVLARVAACSNVRRENRPADCPREAPPSEWNSAARLGGPSRGVRMHNIFTQAELATIIVEPPCVEGLHYNNFAVQGCTRFGITPPGPTLAAEEICDRGGIGPCHPAPFRESDVVRLAHSQ